MDAASVWLLEGVQLVTLPMLWRHLGEEHTANFLGDFYKSLHVYALKHDRVDDRAAKRNRLESQAHACERAISLDAAELLCEEFAVPKNNLKRLARHLRESMLQEESAWLADALPNDADAPSTRAVRFDPVATLPPEVVASMKGCKGPGYTAVALPGATLPSVEQIRRGSCREAGCVWQADRRRHGEVQPPTKRS